MAEFLQLLFSGLTVGAVYALVALGFTLIYNASDVINFAQGDFVMIGGMGTVFLAAAGLSLPLAALIAILAAVAVGLLLHRLAIEPARGASPVALIMITIGASIFIKGIAQIVFDKQFHALPAFTGSEPIALGGATILPQSLWVIGGAIVLFAALHLFLERTLLGKAVLATAANRLAARLVGDQRQGHPRARIRRFRGHRRDRRRPRHADHADALRHRHPVRVERFCRRDGGRHGPPARRRGRRRPDRPDGGFRGGLYQFDL